MEIIENAKEIEDRITPFYVVFSEIGRCCRYVDSVNTMFVSKVLFAENLRTTVIFRKIYITGHSKLSLALEEKTKLKSTTER